MQVLVTFTYNISLKRWYDTGLFFREITLYKELSKEKISFSFLTYGNDNEYNYAKFLGDIKILPLSKFFKSEIFPQKYIKSLLLPFKLKKTLSNIDLIKTVQVYGSWVAFIAKILYNKKIIIRAGFEWLSATKNVTKKNSIKNYLKYLIRYTLIFLNEFFAFKLADGIILTSDYDIPFVLKYYKLKKKFKRNKICLIYNFIDEELFKPIILPKKDKHILYIGSLHRGKNVINLVKTFKILDNYTLDIIGKGPDEENLKQIVKEFNLNVNFLGLFPNNEIPEIINQYNIFLLPSISEGNPKVLLEAMSCGIACIGTNIEGINNIIKHKVNGILCDTDPESIAEAVLSLDNNKQLMQKIAKNAREYILDNCSLKAITQKEFLFYKKILDD